MAAQPKPGSRAYMSAQMMTDFHRIEEMSKRPKGARVTEDDVAFLNALLSRLPADMPYVRDAVQRIKGRYVRLN